MLRPQAEPALPNPIRSGLEILCKSSCQYKSNCLRNPDPEIFLKLSVCVFSLTEGEAFGTQQTATGREHINHGLAQPHENSRKEVGTKPKRTYTEKGEFIDYLF